jgi:hypothetical protein
MDDYFIPITAAEWRYLRTLAEPTCCAACGVVVKGDGIEQDVGCAYVLCAPCYETAKKEAE